MEHCDGDRKAVSLGHLEARVMEILWARGKSSVHDVLPEMGRPLAYTTVMTTLDRLFKKGLLEREESSRTFFYTARFSRAEWEQKRASDFMTGFPRDLLVSCFLELVGDQNEALLDELERKIAQKRQELQQRGKA
jgi:predicted transcriptional regulator